MQEKEIKCRIEIYERASEMEQADASLIGAAAEALAKSYSPYSGFRVGAAALLHNGAIVSGANQENASYPVCICAEVVALSACSAQYPGIAIRKMAITTRGSSPSGPPKAPCGQCRQALLEFEQRYKTDISIIMCSEGGQVYKVNSVKELLPLFFSGKDL